MSAWRTQLGVRAARGRIHVGDVSSSYLPYAQALLEASPCTTLLVLQREKEEVVRSFDAKSGASNYWAGALSEGASAEVRKDEEFWGPFFPHYPSAESKQEALRAYWDAYAAESARLAEAWPLRVRVYESPRVLQAPQLAWEALRFAGFERPVLRGGWGGAEEEGLGMGTWCVLSRRRTSADSDD